MKAKNQEEKLKWCIGTCSLVGIDVFSTLLGKTPFCSTVCIMETENYKALNTLI